MSVIEAVIPRGGIASFSTSLHIQHFIGEISQFAIICNVSRCIVADNRTFLLTIRIKPEKITIMKCSVFIREHFLNRYAL
jgi:hypothetical protein